MKRIGAAAEDADAKADGFGDRSEAPELGTFEGDTGWQPTRASVTRRRRWRGRVTRFRRGRSTCFVAPRGPAMTWAGAWGG